MLTYVINTSENKTFDSSVLFEQAGYTKIQWMQCSLDEIFTCAEVITEKQNILGAERFRVAVIVDFFGFDKIRSPYGRLGYQRDDGVDMSLYLPYIEAYLMDNFIAPLEKSDLYTSDFEVYYVQNEKSERYEVFTNEREQLELVMEGRDVYRPFDADGAETNSDIEEEDDNVYLCENGEKIPAIQHTIPDIKGVVCREAKNWTVYSLFWKNGSRVLNISLPDEWLIKDDGPETHLITCGGVPVGRISVVPPKKAVDDNIARKRCEITDIKLDYSMRLMLDKTGYHYRHLFDITIPEDGEENKLYIEVDYEYLCPGKSVDYILRTLTTCKRSDLTKDAILVEVDDVYYTSFALHCTESVDLVFRLKDYPYGADRMTFDQFWNAFCHRRTLKIGLRRHYYIVPYGGGPSRMALDTLSLSLYLIRMYEREEDVIEEGELEVFHLDSNVLKDVLVSAWSRINVAQNVVRNTLLDDPATSADKKPYYALDSKLTAGPDAIKVNVSMTPEEKRRAEIEGIERERIKIIAENKKDGDKRTTRDVFGDIISITDCAPGKLNKKKREDFDVVMGDYLAQRDSTKEANVEKEFNELKAGGFLEKVAKCPSKEEYNHYVDKKEREISKLFERVLSADYIKVDYTKERKEATEAMRDYKRAEARLKRNIVGDVIFLILTLIAMFVPYVVLQLTSYNSQTVSAIMLSANMLALFGGLFILAMLIQLIPLVSMLRKSKNVLKNCLLNCRAKDNYAFSAIKQRYEKDLIAIEQARYDLRQLKKLYDENIMVERIFNDHRQMLHKLEDALSSILNNLDVEPVIDPLDHIDGDVNFFKPVKAKENKLYQIFSVEVIEKMFSQKGRD